MANALHTLFIDSNNTLTATGVVSVESLTDKQCLLVTEGKRLVVKGDNLVMHKLDADEGKVTINSTAITAINYFGGKGKFNVKKLFS